MIMVGEFGMEGLDFIEDVVFENLRNRQQVDRPVSALRGRGWKKKK